MPQSDNRQVDFEKLKQRVSITDVVDHYGWLSDLKAEGASFVGRCPIHDGNGKRQFVVTPPKAWKCFGSCDTGGNQLDFVAKVEGVNLREGALLMAQWFGIDDCWRETTEKNADSGSKKRGSKRRSKPKAARDAASKRDEDVAKPQAQEVRRNKPLGWKRPLQGLDHEHEWFDHLSILPDTLEEFGIGVANSGMMEGAAAVPIRNGDSDLLAYAGREIEKDGKAYRYPDNFIKELELYNLHRAMRSEAFWDDGLIITLDFFDVLQLYESGDENAVAVMGTTISDEQVALLQMIEVPNGAVTVLVHPEDVEAGAAVAYRLCQIVGSGLSHIEFREIWLPETEAAKEDQRSAA